MGMKGRVQTSWSSPNYFGAVPASPQKRLETFESVLYDFHSLEQMVSVS
jgi:hypothetical protein